MTEIMQLEEEIRYHNKLYWEKNQPEISDIEYDTLTRELTKLNPTNSLLTVIHSPISTKGLKVKHKVKMLSLNKVYTIPELLTWCAKVSRGPHEQFLIQIKYDGCSANFTNGVLATRGDGEIGENITDKLPLIEMGVRKRDVRGEIIFRKSVFEKYKTILKKRDGTPYSNARNACAGMLNKDDLPVKEAILELIPFGMETTKGSLTDLKVFDFDSYIKEVEELDYPADGLVIKLADLDYKESLGYTSHHSRGEIALKFANESATTQLLDVTWSMGKEVITPIGNVQPVEISGVIVSNVSLHNMKFIMDMGIRIGDTLTIERAGDVIPHVINVTPASTPQINITISICPECNGLVAYAEPNIYCVNPHCKGKKVNRLYDSITRIGIDRIGKPTIKNMVDILEVDNLIDIFQLTKESLLRLPKFGEKKASNTLNEIHKVNDEGVYEWQILAAMNIPGIGRTLSKTLCKEFGLNSLMALCLHSFAKHKLIAIEGIEEKRASDIVNGVLINMSYLTGLRDMLYLKFDEVKEETNMETVCFSGKFPEQKSVYYEKLKGRYEIAKSVTKSLDILVVADPSKGSSKQKKAEKMGIKIMSLEEING